MIDPKAYRPLCTHCGVAYESYEGLCWHCEAGEPLMCNKPGTCKCGYWTRKAAVEAAHALLDQPIDWN